MSTSNENKTSKNLVKDLWNKGIIYKIILVLLYPFTITYLIYKSQKFSKPIKTLLILGLFGMIAIMQSSNKEEPQYSSKTEEKIVIKEETKTAEIPVQKKDEEPKELTLMDKLWLAVDNGIGSREGIDITYGDKTKTAYVTYTDTNFWDETDAVRNAYTKLIKYSKKAFEIKEVNEVSITIITGIKDFYGNTNNEDVVVISMTKDSFNKFNWEELKGTNVKNQMENGSSYYFIHPALKSGLKQDKLYLSF